MLGVQIRFLEIKGMYGPISGNIPGIATADASIIFEFLAKVIFVVCKTNHVIHK